MLQNYHEGKFHLIRAHPLTSRHLSLKDREAYIEGERLWSGKIKTCVGKMAVHIIENQEYHIPVPPITHLSVQLALPISERQHTYNDTQTECTSKLISLQHDDFLSIKQEMQMPYVRCTRQWQHPQYSACVTQWWEGLAPPLPPIPLSWSSCPIAPPKGKTETILYQ